MDIAACVEALVPGADYRSDSTYASLVATWNDARPVPTQEELDLVWEGFVDTKLVLTTNATDSVTPHAGVPDIPGDGTSTCTITITKKRTDGSSVSTPKLVGTTTQLASGATAGPNVVVTLVSAPGSYKVGNYLQIKEGATEEVCLIEGVDQGAKTVTVDLTNTYTSAATVQRCVPQTDAVYIKTTGGQLSAQSVNLVDGVGSVTLTSSAETKLVTVTAWDGDAKGVTEGSIEIQFRI